MDCCDPNKKEDLSDIKIEEGDQAKVVKKQKILNFRIIAVGAFLLLIVSIALNAFLAYKIIGNDTENQSGFLIKSALAQEVYDMFVCPCCGKPIDTDCCGMAKGRKEFTDSLIESGKSEDEIITEYVATYGLDSFKDEDKVAEYREKLIAKAPKDRPIISTNIDHFDFGDLSLKNGVATTQFEIMNEGTEDLIINKLETSCGCTSASIIFNGVEGPISSMPGHGKDSPEDWEVIIPAGKGAQLKVYYDPSVHEDFQGTAIREVYISSNDPIDLTKKVTVELNQVH